MAVPPAPPSGSSPAKPFDQLSDQEKAELKKKNAEKDEQAKRDKATKSGQLDAADLYNKSHGFISWRRVEDVDPDDPHRAAPGMSSRNTKLLPDGLYEFAQMDPDDKDKTHKQVWAVRVSNGMVTTVPPFTLQDPKLAGESIRKQIHFVGGQGQTLHINFGPADRTVNWKYEAIADPQFVKKCAAALLGYIHQCKELGVPYVFEHNAQALMEHAFTKDEIKQMHNDRMNQGALASQATQAAADKAFEMHKSDIAKLPSATVDPAVALVDSKGVVLTDDAKLTAIDDHMNVIEKQIAEVEEARKILENNADGLENVLKDPARYGLSASRIEDRFASSQPNRGALIGELEQKRNELTAQLTVWDNELGKIPVPPTPAVAAGAAPPPPPPIVARLDGLKDRQKKLADRCGKDQAAEKSIQAKFDNVPDLVQQAKMRPTV